MRDEVWFEALYRAHHAVVLAYARRRVDDADDVLAEVFTTAWRRRERIPEPALPWLLRTAAHHVAHAQRAKGRRARLRGRVVALIDETPDLEEQVVSAQDTSAAVLAALARLRPDDQEILRLSAWEDLDAADLGAVLACSAATARVRLHRARRRLEQQLAATPFDLERQR